MKIFKPSVIFGFLLLILVTILIICLSLPMYVFRKLATLMAILFRPDLIEIMSPQDSMLVNDLFEITSPRSNVISGFTFQGTATCKEWQNKIKQNLIQNVSTSNGKLGFQKFQMYPERWLGFTFWKKPSSSIKIENHVHKLFGMEVLATREEVLNATEMLLNSRLPKQQSPWEVYIVENFAHPEGKPGCSYSVVIFKWHHSLADGSMSWAISKAAMGEVTLPDISKVKTAKKQTRSFWEQLVYFCKRSTSVVTEVSCLCLHAFANHPFFIRDTRKEWYQLVVSSAPIELQLIKKVKNFFGASYSSVLLSGISAAASRHLTKSTIKNNTYRVLCANVLPLSRTPVKALELGNDVTASIVNLKLKPFCSSVDRLNSVQLEYKKGRKSMIPAVNYYWTLLLGSWAYPISRLMTKNKYIQIGFSNVPYLTYGSEEKTKNVVSGAGISGATSGDMGIFVTITSCDKTAIIMSSVEKGVMSKQEAVEFVQHIADEITALGLLIETTSLGMSKVDVEDNSIIL